MIKIKIMMYLAVCLLTFSCNSDNEEMATPDITSTLDYDRLPLREGSRPATTDGIPHHQIDLDLVPDVHQEMIRRIYSVPGIKDQPSAILSWQGLGLESDVTIVNPQALLNGEEFGHIHDDGSLHIFLEPGRAIDAIKSGWAVAHPFNLEGRDGWEGFVLLYTPQSIEELNVVFQLIVESFNYVTGEQVEPTDFY